ncbi:protein translocase subunit SecF [Candidatus Woesearchaeota archaeon]|nr:protein translocase subunit SecF [Candidatus Woesearchaeota archaeon]
MSLKETLFNIYDKKYKTLLIITLLIFFTSLLFLFLKYNITGNVVERGISLKGGLELSFAANENINTADLEKTLQYKLENKDISVRSITELGVQKEIIIESTEGSEEKLIEALAEEGFKLEKPHYTTQTIGSRLGESFFRQTIYAMIFAFIAMSVVVFITFREFVPSLFVILSALSSIVTTLAVVSIAEIKLSTAGIAAFLMLIGYSVDTDVLLTTRVMKRKEGTVLEKTISAMKTGLTMTGTSIVAVMIGYFLTSSETIKQIMFIILVGLTADIYNTWIQNAGILRWYLEKKNGKQI